MIYTITLNPALDNTIYVDDLIIGEVNRSKTSMVDVGGKGINVSKLIRVLDGESIALGFLGNDNKESFIRYLDKQGIKHDFIFVDGQTRTNIKLVDEKNNIYTDINQRGFEVKRHDIEDIINEINNIICSEDIVILAGSLPSGADNQIYFDLINLLKSKNVMTIFDADGDSLKKGMEAKPYLIKPNVNELKEIYNFNPESIDDIINIASEIVDSGINTVVVSMGGNGSIYATKEEVLVSKPIKVEVKSTVGAGDSMVAGFAYGLSKKLASQDIFKLAVACSTAKVMEKGTRPPKKDDVYKIIDKVTIERRK